MQFTLTTMVFTLDLNFHWFLFCPPEKARAPRLLFRKKEKLKLKNKKKTGYGAILVLTKYTFTAAAHSFTFNTANNSSFPLLSQFSILIHLHPHYLQHLVSTTPLTLQSFPSSHLTEHLRHKSKFNRLVNKHYAAFRPNRRALRRSHLLPRPLSNPEFTRLRRTYLSI